MVAKNEGGSEPSRNPVAFATLAAALAVVASAVVAVYVAAHPADASAILAALTTMLVVLTGTHMWISLRRPA